MEKIEFEGENGDIIEFGILEQTRINGSVYLLVVEPDDVDDEQGSGAFILKDVSKDGEEESCYEFVEDDTEFDAVYKVFDAMLEDIDFEN